MNRNTTNFFAEEATIDIQRSMWTTHHNHKTTFNNGELIPFYVDIDVFPGMTIKNKTACLIRMSTPKFPIMDNLYLDTYYFKVPIWTIWDNFKKFQGENELGAWTQTTEYQIPQFKTTNRAVDVHDTNAYMGIPIGVKGLNFSQLGVRAYCRVYNFWFRDQNLIAPLQYETGDDDIETDGSEITGGKLLRAAKFHDYFTSALPEPQKGDAIRTPLGIKAPIKSYTSDTSAENTSKVYGFASSGVLSKPNTTIPLGVGTGGDVINGTGTINYATDFRMAMYADLTQATAATINALRLAFATQRILEKDARFGTRYNEIIRGQFGVNSPNASLHVPEYLGGKRIPINIETVLQNGASNDMSPLGQTGAFSVSFDVNEDFTKSFDEHCVIIGIAVVRANHTYQQGLARMWSKRRRLDFYFPSLAHIGNQPIYNREIYAQGNATDDEVFGYKEAHAEYKYKPDRISGEFLSTYTQSLDAWHLGDDYNSLPVLSKEWIEEPDTYLNRALLINSSEASQFIADFEIQQEVAAPMPVHCTPGLIDHF